MQKKKTKNKSANQIAGTTTNNVSLKVLSVTFVVDMFSPFFSIYSRQRKQKNELVLG